MMQYVRYEDVMTPDSSVAWLESIILKYRYNNCLLQWLCDFFKFALSPVVNRFVEVHMHVHITLHAHITPHTCTYHISNVAPGSFGRLRKILGGQRSVVRLINSRGVKRLGK